jgi:excisionase family DNA binding protein
VAELEDFNSAEKVALYLDVSRSSVYRLTETGLMGHVKIGALVRIRRQDVEAFLSVNTHPTKERTE